VVLAAAALLAITAWVLRQRRVRPYLAVGWLWFVGMLVPVSGVVQVGQAAMADRYTYLPLIGLSIMVAWGGREIAMRGPRFARATRYIAVVALAALAVASAVQVRTWRDSRRLFEHALRVTSRNHVAHINLGQALAGAGLFEEAAIQLDAALLLVPASATAWGLRGEIRVAQERFEAAGDDFRAALRLAPGSARWSTGLGRALAELGEVEAAAETLRAVVERHPDHAQAHALLGAVLLRGGQLREALESYERALVQEARLTHALGPEGVARVHAQLATLLERDGRPDEAVLAYREALRLGERSLRVLNNLAWLLATSDAPDLRSPAEAVALAREAVAVSAGENPAVLDTLATAQLAAGHRAEARTTAARALALAESQGRQALAHSIRTRFELNLGDVPAS
jgi:Tfp pilus assembly protein PilF